MSTNRFIYRHIGPRANDVDEMLAVVGSNSMEEFISSVVPSSIRMKDGLNLPPALTEHEYFVKLREAGARNQQFRSMIGMGYYGTVLPAVIKRNILENPSWYTSYTPYQAEISQGRLEALLNFQTMIIELTGLPLANASLLDEGTAAAEAMIMMHNIRSKELVNRGANVLWVDENIFPQTLEVIRTRALPLGIEVKVVNVLGTRIDETIFGIIAQYPAGDGKVLDFERTVNRIHELGGLFAAVTDLMSLVLLKAPGEWGADIALGSSQRFGIPMGYGGPHAAFFATREEYKRYIPGRIIGVSVDMHGNKALRMALQTREQHIKRERATSNICTAQALLATMAGMYAIYHGPDGLLEIAGRIHRAAHTIELEIKQYGYVQENKDYFDTLRIVLPENVTLERFKELALRNKFNFRYFEDDTIGLSTDELTDEKEIDQILAIFAEAAGMPVNPVAEFVDSAGFDREFARETDFMGGLCFNRYQSETEMMRYIKKLEQRDISLTQSMIPLGSCTMKLNSANSMFALSWPEFGDIHPFVPIDQAQGYQQIINELGDALCEITGFKAISFQPNSGASGEYAGLSVINRYHQSRGEGYRNVVLIPASAHGTNPASAVMAGGRVVVVKCDDRGNVDLEDLKAKAKEHSANLSAFMITYPSTHGVFETEIREMLEIIHANGGQVYMDGANMNAQVGLTKPALIGADVCHLNLHKTFGIPHGGGGPGVGPIGVAAHLVDFLPTHPVVPMGGSQGGVIASAPYGSALILTISHAYIQMLGPDGLAEATKLAILNANYLAFCLKDYFKVLYSGANGRVAHECILDCRDLKQRTGVETSDIARRLMDYGFHAPTLSFPVHETLMVEPTESESKEELDRFIEAMISIFFEISDVESGITERENNVLKNAPHTANHISCDTWTHPYGRQKAAYPLPWIKENKFWPYVGKIDNAFGDRNLVCSCQGLEE
ncbi:MAG: aminomethyl-transferring glycine dehydrogenase [Bacteroidales bacterium]|nr:aminomethyl-transferring glycine dehydrogenase [Bacteroidales bacterium]